MEENTAKRGLKWLHSIHAERKSRGELFLTTWFTENKTSGTNVEKLIRLCERYRSRDLENDPMDELDYIEAADDILKVVPEGVDDYWVNRIVEMLGTVDLKRIRRCMSCGRWLYALHPRRKHCSDECRDRFRMNDDDYRARKREDMRRLRKINKEREEARRAYREREDPASASKTQMRHNSNDSS